VVRAKGEARGSKVAGRKCKVLSMPSLVSHQDVLADAEFVPSWSLCFLRSASAQFVLEL
jgi:hypothetical protein